MTRSEAPDRWLSLSEASALLGVHTSTLRRWADNGRVACRRTPGGHRRFSRRRLEPLLRPEARPASELHSEPVDAQPWHEQFAAAGVVGDLRALGQRLSGLLIQVVIRSDDDPRYLEEGRELAHLYGARTRGAGIELLDAVRAFLYYRSSFTDMLDAAPSEAARSGALYARYDAFMSQVLLGLIAGYQGRMGPSLSKPHTRKEPHP